jgi:radical SAM protein with 4Fe4S-binding SPASM domain
VPIDRKIVRRKRENVDRFHESWGERRAVVTNTPLEIYLELCNTCNIRCKMCGTREEGWSGHAPLMSGEIYESSYPLFDNALILHPFGFGEPLLHKNFREIIETAKTKRLLVDFFTNATLLKEELARAIVRAGVDRIVVSFNGATKETYETIHAGAKFEKVIGNLRFVNELKKRYVRARPELSLIFIAMRSNFGELPRLLELGASWGLGSLELKTLVTYESMPDMEAEKKIYDPETDSVIIDQCRRIADRHKINLFLDQFLSLQATDVRPLSSEKPVEHNLQRYIAAARGLPYCIQPFSTVYLKSDGSVKPCCFHADYDFLGNVREKPLLEIWNGSAFQEFRRMIAGNQVPGGCRHCIENNLMLMQDYSEHMLALVFRSDFAVLPVRMLMRAFLQNPVDARIWEYVISSEFKNRVFTRLKRMGKKV